MASYNAEESYSAKLVSETTANIDQEIYEKISEAAKKYGVSRSKLVAMLLERFVNAHKKTRMVHGTVRYQESRPKENWRTLHITLPAHWHDFFDDARKLWKLSVSFLIAMAVEQYLTDDDNGEDFRPADNYWWGAHTIIQFTHNDLQYVLLCWGVPTQPPEIPKNCFAS